MNMVDEVIREAKKSILTINIQDGSKLISVEYDEYSDTFKTTIVAPYKPKKGIIGEKEAREIISMISEESIKNTLNTIKADNDRYYTAKLRLIKMALENFNDAEVIKILNVLDVVCVPTRYAGMGNRYHINGYTELRLTDESRWNDAKEELHLQKVIVNYDGNLTLHCYPKESEIEILREIIAL